MGGRVAVKSFSPQHRPKGRFELSVRLSLAGLLIGSFTVAAQSVTRSQAEVEQALQRGANDEAITLAQQGLKAAPRDCALLSLEAIGQAGLQKFDPALQSFKKALGYCPTYVPALKGAAQIESVQGNPDAVLLLNRILTLEPHDAGVHAMLATTLRAQDRCGDALVHYEAAKALYPSRPDLVEGYASCVARGGDTKSALALYLQLLATDPSNAVRYDVSLLQWKTQAPDDALATLAPLVSEEKWEPALALASKIHEELGQTPEAVNLLREAILRSPDHVDNYIDFAAIAFTHKSFQVGIDMLDAGLTRLPDSAPLYVARGVLEAQISKDDAAIADFEQAFRLDRKLSLAVDAMGIMQSQEHESMKSLALFQDQAKKRPDDPLLQYLLAEQLSAGLSDDGGASLKAAIIAANRAVNLEPDYQAAHDLLAVLYNRAKQPQLAIQHAKLAIAIDPYDTVAIYQEILGLRSSGDRNQVQELVAKLNSARKEEGRRQQDADRYRLQDDKN
jgi:tetratricopeptide (TPR) repeat protein